MGKQAKAKARFYANQARDNKITQQQASNAIAGKGLNVSAPKTSTNSAYAGSPLFNPANYAGNEGMAGGTNSAYKGSPLFNPSNYAENQSSSNKSSGSSSSKSTPNRITDTPTNNRSLAQSAFNKLTGVNTAQASETAHTPAPITEGGVKGAIKSGVASLINFRNQSNDWARNHGIDTPFNHDFGISEILGIPKSSIIPEQQQINPNFTQTINPFDVIGRTTPNDVSQLNDIANGTPINFNTSPALSSRIDRSTINTEQDRPSNTNRNNQNRNPRQVSSPFVAPNPFIASQQEETAQIHPQIQHQDYTPAQTQQGGTQRQFLGNGILSNGIASNGGGNYGVQGAMTKIDNQDNNSTIDDLLTLLGVKPMTAQAAETQNYSQPQSSFNFAASPFGKATTSPSTMQGNAYAGSPLFNPANFAGATNANPNPQIKGQGIEGTGKGIISQTAKPTKQSAQPVDQSTALLQKQEKGYSAQEKAQKKALNELIDSIKKQYSYQIDATNKNYDIQQTQGQSDLEKAKQADLMQLSGLFNFSANQSPDSEQRLQYQQRAQDQANTNLANFLAKLSAARGTDLASLQSSQDKDISGAKTNYQSQLADIAAKKNATQLEIAKMIDDAKQKALDRASKGSSGGSTSAGSVTYIGDNAQGEPVYRNSKTGEMMTASGLRRKTLDPFTAFLQGQQGTQSQGGSWEIDPQTGQQVWVTD